jgi:hypothetical protein
MQRFEASALVANRHDDQQVTVCQEDFGIDRELLTDLRRIGSSIDLDLLFFLLDEDVGGLVLIHIGPDLEFEIEDAGQRSSLRVEQDALEVPRVRIDGVSVWHCRPVVGALCARRGERQ